MIKNTFIFIHGMGGSGEDHWYPWLADKLRKLNHGVILKTFPQNLKSRKELSMKFVKDTIKDAGEVSFITHSSGSAVAFRIAEEQSVGDMFIVSGLFEDLGYEEEIESELFEGGFDFTRIRKNSGKITQIDSDNDPYIPNHHFEELAKKLNSKHITLPGRRHFGDPEDSPKTFPELFKLIINTNID